MFRLNFGLKHAVIFGKCPDFSTIRFLHFDDSLWSKSTIYTLCVPLGLDLNATVKSSITNSTKTEFFAYFFYSMNLKERKGVVIQVPPIEAMNRKIAYDCWAARIANGTLCLTEMCTFPCW